MKIKEVNIISFGKFNNFKFKFNDGLNLIYGENEKGKSTILAFIKVMLYGMNSQKMSIADNERRKYFSFDTNKAMGTLTVEINGRDYLIEREFKENKRGDTLNIYDLQTGEKVDQNIIEMDEDTFKTTAFIEQGRGIVDRDRVINLKETGSEEVSYEKTIKILKKAIKTTKNSTEEYHRQKEDLENELLEYKRIYESNKDNIIDLKENYKQRKKIQTETIVNKEIEIASGYVDELKESIKYQSELNKEVEKFKDINEKEILSKQNKIENISEYEGSREKLKASSIKMKISFVLMFLAFLGTIGSAVLVAGKLSYLILAGMSGLVTFILYIVFRKSFKEVKEYEKMVDTLADMEEVRDELNLFYGILKVANYNELIANIKEARQGEDVINLLRVKLRSRESDLALSIEKEKNRQLLEVEKNIASLNTAIDKDFEKYADRLTIEENLENIKIRIHELNFKRESLELSLEHIIKSHKTLSETFILKLKSNMENIFNKITGGKYNRLILDGNMDISVKHEGGLYKDKDFLSRGTIDALYFALRYSMLKIVEDEKQVLFLDDTFAMYDENRLEGIMKFLLEESKERQIIILSCHSREKDLLHKDANLIVL